MPTYPFPLDNDIPYPWLRGIEPLPAEEDTRPCPAVDEATQPFIPPVEANSPSDLPSWWKLDMAVLDGMTTVDYLNSDEMDETSFASVGTNGVVAVRSSWPVGTEVMVTVMRMGGR